MPIFVHTGFELYVYSICLFDCYARLFSFSFLLHFGEASRGVFSPVYLDMDVVLGETVAAVLMFKRFGQFRKTVA